MDGELHWDNNAECIQAHEEKAEDLMREIIGERAFQNPNRMKPEAYVNRVYADTAEPWCEAALLVMERNSVTLLDPREGVQPDIPAIRREVERVETETLQRAQDDYVAWEKERAWRWELYD